MTTATEIQLRMREGERLLGAYRDWLHEYWLNPILRRTLWRSQLLHAMRSTAYQLTYTRKD